MGSVFMTGATGFLGSRIARSLIERGDHVIALHRASSDRRALLDLEIEWVEGDLGDGSGLGEGASRLAARDADGWVVHSGALISYRTAEREAQVGANVEGTARLLEALGAAGLGRMLHVSSVVTVGASRDPGVALTEESECGPPVRSAYVATKRAAEKLVLEFGANSGRDVRAVCPGAIFGPTRAANTSRFLDEVRKRGAPLGVPPGSLSPVGVGDVAEGVLLAMERGRAGRRYLLTESSATMFELYTAAARAFNQRPPKFTVPGPLWRALAAGARPVDAVRELQLLTPESLELLGLHFRYDSERARTELGWEPQPFSGVLGEVAEYLGGGDPGSVGAQPSASSNTGP